MTQKPTPAAFDLQPIKIPLDSLIETRPIKNASTRFQSYRAIIASVKEVGLIQPLVVCPTADSTNKYKILDGHMRYYALREIGETEALCVISKDDERYTFDAQVNHINPIQRHKMLQKAVKDGVSPERIAAALDMDVKKIIGEVNLLDGINPEAVEILKDKPIRAGALKLMRKVKPMRQIEMAENMSAVNNFTEGYAKALITGTRKDQMVNGKKMKEISGITPEAIARMEQEMESLHVDFAQLEQTYSENVYKLTVIQGYLKKLLHNGKIRRFIEKNNSEILPELDRISEMDSLAV